MKETKRLYLSVREVAQALGCCQRTIQREIARGNIPAIRTSGRYFLDPKAVTLSLSNAAKKK